jgi:hypothetical protein
VRDEKSLRGLDPEGLIKYPNGFWDQVDASMVSQHGHVRDREAWRRLNASLRTKPTRKRNVDIKSLELAVLKHRKVFNEIPWKRITEDPAFPTLFGLSPRVLGDAWASEQESQVGSDLPPIKRARR